jgi:hypothetical protein
MAITGVLRGLAPRVDLLDIGRLTGQRLATERDRAWRKPGAARSDHAASSSCPVRVLIVGGPQVPAHRARASIDSIKAPVSTAASFTLGAARP